MSIVDNHKGDFNQSVEYFKKDISSLRTGRATPALVEDLVIEAYGARQALKALASITVQDAKTIAVEPWDKSITMAVEAGIRASQLGINPVNNGKVILLPLPELSSERRQELIKVLHQKIEAARIAIRQLREMVRDEIEAGEKAKEISEDEKYKLQDELEEMVKEFNEKLKELGEGKETEINTI
ncbi:MAG: Ribosome-recycling factor [Candidatus Magasanikbacteria bacterium GW2011_GWC2_37_14]|uniref:Ribosome-recycling factor n=1 Tax=Candidatus Magasanikbacteria bacterium GW2011_GWC2_37_14 TaxID=1619046 RepID=A0A0G0G9E0_9BACT|nr:MAG: Ribosome-recycling factor [Candidatus Magasanikbacteria bacterium GW2011_GWC2_37_14]